MSVTDSLRPVVKNGVRKLRDRAQVAINRGDTVFCPICERSFARFLPLHGRPGAVCPNCRSVERHRAFWLYFQQRSNLFTDSLRVLHFAPEPFLEERLRALPNLDYVTADLMLEDVDLQLDVTKTALPPESYDVVLCSHVLEHVDDDRLAMRELLRITKRGGWAILMAPVDYSRATTYEDWSITTPEGRHEAFGQWDHVRYHGRDYPDLLRAEGWEVEVTPLPLSAAEAARYGIPEKEQKIYVGHRPA